MNKKTIGLMAIVTTLCVGGIFTVNAAFDKKETAKKEVTTYYYGNEGNGHYKLLSQPPNLTNCGTFNSNTCLLVSSEYIEEGFASSEQPDDASPYPGSSNAVYNGI